MDIDSSPTLISPCHAYSYDDDDPPTMPFAKSAPPPSAEIPVVDGDLLEDSEPATLRTYAAPAPVASVDQPFKVAF